MRKSYTVAQKTGALTCAISVLWIYFIGILAAWDQFGRAQDWLDAVVRMALPVLVSIPAILLLVLSCQLMRREATRVRIKNALGLLFGMAAFFFAFFVVWQIEAFSSAATNPMGLVGALFVSILVVLPTNAGVARYVMRASDIVPVKGEFVGQGSYMLLAFLLWSILSPVGMALSDDYQTDSLLDFGFLFVPFIIPYVLYRLAVKYLVRDTFDEEVALDYPSQHHQAEGE